jgi:hypothetical protein
MTMAPTLIVRACLPALLLLIAGHVGANGINPPRAADSVPLAGTCVAWNGDAKRLARVRVDAVDGDRLKVRRGVAVVWLALGDVKELTLGKGKPDRNGELAATLVRSDGSAPEAVRVAVAAGGRPVRIVGFAGGPAAESVALAECRTLAMERQRDDCAAAQPAAAVASAATPAGPEKSASSSASASLSLPAVVVVRPPPSISPCDGPPTPVKKPQTGA